MFAKEVPFRGGGKVYSYRFSFFVAFTNAQAIYLVDNICTVCTLHKMYKIITRLRNKASIEMY